jgi:hypothetical protein
MRSKPITNRGLVSDFGVQNPVHLLSRQPFGQEQVNQFAHPDPATGLVHDCDYLGASRTDFAENRSVLTEDAAHQVILPAHPGGLLEALRFFEPGFAKPPTPMAKPEAPFDRREAGQQRSKRQTGC